jgi:hypothetical protein
MTGPLRASVRDNGQLQALAIHGNELIHRYHRLAVAAFDLHWEAMRVSPWRQIP